MTENIFKKTAWDENDWDIYLNNLDILRLRHNLSKKQLNAAAEKWNLYRRDMGRPGEGTILKVCAVFNVTQLWLSTAHPKPEKDRGEPGLSIKDVGGVPYGVTQEIEIDGKKHRVVVHEPRGQTQKPLPPDMAIQRALKMVEGFVARERELNNEIRKRDVEIAELKNRVATIEKRLASFDPSAEDNTEQKAT